MGRGKRTEKRGIAAHHPEYYTRKFDKKDFVSIRDVDTFNSKKEAERYAKRWRSGNFLARVTKEKAGYRMWIHNPREKKRRRR